MRQCMSDKSVYETELTYCGQHVLHQSCHKMVCPSVIYQTVID